MDFKVRSTNLQRIDTQLCQHLDDEIDYWQKVLQRVVVAIKSLATRGLSFRGHNEKFGNIHNGNYMMMLESISEFDNFLRHGNPGRGNVSYLSSTICDEFLSIIGNQVRQLIVDEIKLAKYYSIIVDSTPDVAHVDQLSLCFRYVSATGEIMERFFTFLPNCGHKSEDMFEAVKNIIETNAISLKDMRGQSYDNASNMSGVYSGLQARFKNINPLAEFTPCSAHSLNLVGMCAAGSCSEAATFFGTVQLIYNFFSASTCRWEIFNKFADLEENKLNKTTIKSLSKTRWSARSDAVKTLNNSWTVILKVLRFIIDDVTQKNTTRDEAKTIYNKLNTLEMCLMSKIWGFLLNRINV